jgi:hypothetical protein
MGWGCSQNAGLASTASFVLGPFFWEIPFIFSPVTIGHIMIILAKKKFGDNPFLTNALWFFSIFQKKKQKGGELAATFGLPRIQETQNARNFAHKAKNP